MDDKPSAGRPLLALLTDFGLKDPYVGQLKGNIMKHCPQATIIDISHEVPTFNIRVGAYFLAATAEHFPEGTVFLGIVDPEVGSSRDLVAFETGGHLFIGPNNGLFCLIKQEGPTSLWKLAQKEPQPNSSPNSSVFAGRDIMAPALGALLSGVPLQSLAEPMDLAELVHKQWDHANLTRGMIEAQVLHIDHFGNVVINLTCKQWNLLKLEKSMLLKICGKELPLFRAGHYAQIPDNTLAILPGSQGYMEIGMNRNEAFRMLGINIDSAAETTIRICY